MFWERDQDFPFSRVQDLNSSEIPNFSLCFIAQSPALQTLANLSLLYSYQIFGFLWSSLCHSVLILLSASPLSCPICLQPSEAVSEGQECQKDFSQLSYPSPILENCYLALDKNLKCIGGVSITFCVPPPAFYGLLPCTKETGPACLRKEISGSCPASGSKCTAL